MNTLTTFSRYALSLVLFSSVAVVGCQEQGADAANMPPKLEVVGGETVDWGDVGDGKLEHTLKIVNVGGDTLRISDVKPSCGCTTAPLDKDMLLAGDTAIVHLTMDVAGRQGATTKSLRIMSNDSTSPTTTVQLKANVIQHVVANPNYFNVSDVEPGKEGSSTIQLVNVGKEPVTVQPPKELDTPLMAVQFDMKEPVTLQVGDSLAVTVRATPLNSGVSSAAYVFKTDSKMSPEVKVSLTVATRAGSPTGTVQGTSASRGG